MAQLESREPIDFILSLRLKRSGKFFGPGVMRLLELTAQTGSLSSAARAMDMAYSKAQRIFKLAQDNLDFPLLERKAGGPGGGGSRLTPQGHAFLQQYQEFVRKSQEAVEAVFRECYNSGETNHED